MFDFQQKRKFRALWASRLLWLPLGVVLVLLFVAAYDRYTIARDMAARRITAESELVRLEERETALREEVEYLGNERGIEATARRQFDIALPGEEMIIILDATTTPVIQENDPMLPVEERPWYQLW